jgi:hypothetical protein
MPMGHPDFESVRQTLTIVAATNAPNQYEDAGWNAHEVGGQSLWLEATPVGVLRRYRAGHV